MAASGIWLEYRAIKASASIKIKCLFSLNMKAYFEIIAGVSILYDYWAGGQIH